MSEDAFYHRSAPLRPVPAQPVPGSPVPGSPQRVGGTVEEFEPSYDEGRPRRRIGLPAVLFLLTCWSTYKAVPPDKGPIYCLGIMTILAAHEMGHFLQAVRYGVPASLPYFLPMPFSPIGTMGAVIAMRPGMGHRRALFDIAITGPLAGLVPSLIFSVVGLYLSRLEPPPRGALGLGEPLLFQGLVALIYGPRPENLDITLHPLAFAGWVGIFLTALNLIPIGQLDGGHILYALLREKAHGVASLLLTTAIAGIIITEYWGWTILVVLLCLMGPQHPPTANDALPLGRTRTVLGWLILPFVIIGFTPVPIDLRP